MTMKKLVSAVVISSLVLATGAALAQSSTIQLLSSTPLKPAERATIGLAKLKPKSLYQITCSISNPDNTPSQKGAINVALSNATVQNMSVNGVNVSNPVVNYVLQSTSNSLVLNSIATNSRASILMIKNQSTVSEQTITIDSCTATLIGSTTSEEKRI